MTQSAELVLMKKSLNTQVFPLLRAAGFKGTYPHFRRITDDKAELLSFMSPGNLGGGFCVGATVIFRTAERAEDTNLFYPADDIPVEKMNWSHGRIRCGLPGMFDGAFYYTDLYAKKIEAGGKHGICYIPASPKRSAAFSSDLAANGYTLVQKADEGIYDRLAAEVVRQIPALLDWFDRMQNFKDLLG